MNSRTFIKFVFVLLVWFIIHIVFYISSTEYKNFFISLKYDEIAEEYINTGSLSTWNTIKWISSYTWSNLVNISDIKEDEKIIEEIVKTDEKITFSWDLEKLELSKEEEFVINLFKIYKLENLRNHSSLFDLTTEYPDPYLEYYNSDNELTLYIFQTKTYSDVLNIFDVISYNLPFKIKKVNNFWESSFYINMDSELVDDYVRFVFSYKNKVFWLKIKKDSYNDVKEVLKKLILK